MEEIRMTNTFSCEVGACAGGAGELDSAECARGAGVACLVCAGGAHM